MSTSRDRSGELDLLIERRPRPNPWERLLAGYAIVLTVAVALLYITDYGDLLEHFCGQIAEPATDAKSFHRRWGGFKERPIDNKCYLQERTAMILSFLVGPLGVDQWYARHWLLASLKMLPGLFSKLSLPLLLLLNWDVHAATAFCKAMLAISFLWCFTDVILWMVGGVYGTPGCPGGSDIAWHY